MVQLRLKPDGRPARRNPKKYPVSFTLDDFKREQREQQARDVDMSAQN